mmetsp:Transcript_120143/g.340014  ORF Transcript_120143/g.340014 Transcript_120143/m.340014 type:complete len:195 (+) Transcript_120143:541-1125(+)
MWFLQKSAAELPSQFHDGRLCPAPPVDFLDFDAAPQTSRSCAVFKDTETASSLQGLLNGRELIFSNVNRRPGEREWDLPETQHRPDASISRCHLPLWAPGVPRGRCTLALASFQCPWKPVSNELSDYNVDRLPSDKRRSADSTERLVVSRCFQAASAKRVATGYRSGFEKQSLANAAKEVGWHRFIGVLTEFIR